VPDQFPQFYLYDSNPLIARLSTESKLGESAGFVTPVALNKSYESGSAIFGPYFENAGSLCDTQGTISDITSYYASSSTPAFITSIQGLSGNYTTNNPFKANYSQGLQLTQLELLQKTGYHLVKRLKYLWGNVLI